ncbi:MAG: glutaminyl-peptide cyclotransferase [Gammaproteobacteria bacterium]|nr:glutaminyl-peptide cyclotransferase [Gammaproteobacteria bacterium]
MFFLNPAYCQAALSPRIIELTSNKQYSHDAALFTQGFEREGDYLYESSGLYGASSLTKRHINNIAPLARYQFPDSIFAEGLSLVGDDVYVISYKEQQGFIFDKHTLRLKKQFKYTGEGWGLCFDGGTLVMSNGSDTLSWYQPESFKFLHSRKITEHAQSVDHLNELECHDGFIYVNIWNTPWIVKIDPRNGEVVQRYSLANLINQLTKSSEIDIANGITYAGKSKHWLITGKYWPVILEVKFPDK